MSTVLYPVGIKTIHGKYFTVETFGDQLSANGPSLRSKQIFVIETDGNGKFAFKSHKGKYLSSDHRDINAAAEKLGDKEWYTLTYNNGVATLQNNAGKYLSADAAGTVTLSSTPGDNESLEIQINYHPQVCLSTQKRYLAVVNGQVISNRDNQFGKETMFTLEEATGIRGQYAIRGCENKYLSVDGNDVKADKTSPDPSTYFCLEFHGTNLGIKSAKTGNYLTVQGNGVKAIRPTVGPKEIYVIEDSHAQVVLKAHNGKYLSFQGTNLISNRDSITNEEIFILEADKDKWAFKNIQEVYWAVNDAGAVTVDSKERRPNTLFTFEYQPDGKLALKAANGKYLTAKPLGGCEAKAAEVSPKEVFELILFNRPQLVPRANQGSFVGQLENHIKSIKAKAEPFTLEYDGGKYAFKAPSGKYMKEGAESRMSASDDKELFFLEFHMNKLAIKNSKGKYLKSENAGWVVANADKPGPTELYEY